MKRAIHKFEPEKARTTPLPGFGATVWNYSIDTFRLDETVAGGFVDEASFPPVTDQGNYSTCVAHAVCSALETQSREAGGDRAYDADLWHCCTIGLNPYMAPNSVGFALDLPREGESARFPEHRNVPLWIWPPYDIGEDCPGDDHPYQRINSERFHSVGDLQRWVSDGKPAIGVISISDDFEDHKGDALYMELGEIKGQHCVLILGYKDGAWFIQNSYGTGWGENGRGWIDGAMCKLMADDIHPAFRLFTA